MPPGYARASMPRIWLCITGSHSCDFWKAGAVVYAAPRRATARRKPVGEPVFSAPRFRPIVELLDVAPVVSCALGAVAGFPAARLVASHFSVMTRETAQVLIGGPALVERALGEQKTKAELGGYQVHTGNGVVDNVADDEAQVFEQVRAFLSYLPLHTGELPPFSEGSREPGRSSGRAAARDRAEGPSLALRHAGDHRARL